MFVSQVSIFQERKEVHGLLISIPDSRATLNSVPVKPYYSWTGAVLSQKSSMEVTCKPWAKRESTPITHDNGKGIWYLICSGVPPDVALVMAHAASFLVRNSAFWRISINTGKIFASMTAWERIWVGREEKVSCFKKRNQIQPTNHLRGRHLPFLGVFLCSSYIGGNYKRIWFLLPRIFDQ